jgi:hypothetical protein
VPITTTRVVNKDRGDEFDVYIGRKGPWGNPYVIGQDGGRDDVIEKYRDYFYAKLVRDDATRKGLLSLRGLRLGCHCKPYGCHGDVIAEYLNTLPAEVPSNTERSEEVSDDESTLRALKAS